jgi:hypothetical protein
MNNSNGKAKMKHYMIHIQGEYYSRDQYARSRKEAIELFKKLWNLERMPRGYAIWEA